MTRIHGMSRIHRKSRYALARSLALLLTGAALLSGSLASCTLDNPGGEPIPPLADDDPLAIDETLDPESFDAIHRDVILPSCASTQAFCHHGQFEPNLSTPALAYNALVRRPGIELFDRYRVTPGQSDDSLLIDKLRGTAGVATVMPLGAPLMPEEDIQRIEKWINDGALRHPGAAPAPQLNDAPLPPELGIFDDTGSEMGAIGSAAANVGQLITLRHSAQDFETPDEQIPLGAVMLQLNDGRVVVMDPEYPDGFTFTSYDPSGPDGVADQLNWRYDWVVPDMLEVTADGGLTSELIPASGQSLILFGFYVDGPIQSSGILTFSFELDALAIVGAAP